jgi:hypothetical protein
MRNVLLLAALVVAIPAAAQDHAHHERKPASQAAKLPAGWNVRVDRDAPAEGVHAAAEGGAYRVHTGPAGVFYNPSWKRSGDYRVAARLTQMSPSAHPEGYGLVIGGQALNGKEQSYTYFLVRSTGEYFIATRNGAERVKLADWTASPAIRKADNKGRMANTLSVAAAGDQVLFSINGKEVARRPRSEIRTDGIHGFRVNHNLDVKIELVDPAEK